MEELAGYNAEYEPFFAWVKQQDQEMQTAIGEDVRLLLLVFDAGLTERAVFEAGCRAAGRLQRAASQAGYAQSAGVFAEDCDYCCFMLGLRR